MAATFNESNTNVSNIVNNSKESVDNFTEFDDVTLLKQYLGDRYMPLWSLVLLNITYITIFVTGLVGNVCTCIVITRNRYVKSDILNHSLPKHMYVQLHQTYIYR